MDNKQREWLLLFAFKCGADLCIVYVVYGYVFSLFTEDSWPPKNDAPEAAMIARYKKKLAIADNPLSPRKPEAMPTPSNSLTRHVATMPQPMPSSGWVVRAENRRMADGEVFHADAGRDLVVGDAVDDRRNTMVR